MTGNDRTNLNVNQQLQDYMVQLQSDVGCFGKTLHQVISHYLALKGQNPELTHILDSVDIPNVEQTSSEQFERNRELVRLLQAVSERALQGFSTVSEHPWKGFAHFDHRNENSDAFIRLMRFVGIQLNKFWVEVQSFPIFLNGLPHLSLREVESIFQWLQSCPSWKESVQQPRLVPALIGADSRKGVFDFARDVKSSRILQEKIASQMSSEFLSPHLIDSGVVLLTQGSAWVRQYEFGTSTRKDLVSRIDFLKKRITQVKEVREVFDALNKDEAIPAIGRPSEAKVFLEGVDLLRNLSRNLTVWRNPKTLSASQLVRLQIWKDRARPLLETRKKLLEQFQLDRVSDSEKLRAIAFQLSSGGLLRGFSSAYQGAVQAYRELLRPEVAAQSKRGPSRLQMSEKLLEWANYLEQSIAFENQSDLKTVLGHHAKGLDSDFASAMAVNVWATGVRQKLKPEFSDFALKWMEFIFACPEKSIDSILTLTGPIQDELQKSLASDSEFLKDRELTSIQGQDEKELSDLTGLLNAILRVSYQEEGLLLGLESCRVMVEEVAFLNKRMEEIPELKPAFRSFLRGSETDLSLIDQALGYIQYIENASIPEALRESFLSAQGPQRIEDSKVLLNGARNSLAAVREHLERLNTATQGQIQEWVQGPIPELMNRIQAALKQPALLPDWVEYLRCQNEVKQRGLEPFLSFLENSTGGMSFDLAFEIAFYASLLKKLIGNPGNATAVLDLRTFH